MVAGIMLHPKTSERDLNPAQVPGVFLVAVICFLVTTVFHQSLEWSTGQPIEHNLRVDCVKTQSAAPRPIGQVQRLPLVAAKLGTSNSPVPPLSSAVSRHPLAARSSCLRGQQLFPLLI